MIDSVKGDWKYQDIARFRSRPAQRSSNSLKNALTVQTSVSELAPK